MMFFWQVAAMFCALDWLLARAAPPLGGPNLKIFPNRGAALSRRGSGKFFKLRVPSRLENCFFWGSGARGSRGVLVDFKGGSARRHAGAAPQLCQQVFLTHDRQKNIKNHCTGTNFHKKVLKIEECRFKIAAWTTQPQRRTR